jgi:hypothetical protein
VKILVVEDKPTTASYLRNGLVENGFVAAITHHGDDELPGGEYDQSDARWRRASGFCLWQENRLGLECAADFAGARNLSRTSRL